MGPQRPLHVEVVVDPACNTPLPHIRHALQEHLQSLPEALSLSKAGRLDAAEFPEVLRQSCHRDIQFDDDSEAVHSFCGSDPFQVHVFKLSDEPASTEELEPNGGDDEWTAGCDSLPLPHVSLDGLWENLIFESNVKCSLLDYAQSSLLFSDKSVSSHVVHWNRILLLHGVPGTGKTSLCRALAHKLAIRLDHRFPRATLLEIHSHSLFSKWFSTSGKLVSALFDMVRDMVQDDPLTLVCVLVDEVESLASSRSNQSGGDPSDAMRAVNSLLTSLDRLRYFPNVLVLATTNLTGSVDAAFVDRVDINVHIGLPILKARYEILKSCLEELVRVKIVEEHGFTTIPSYDDQETAMQKTEMTNLLLDCAEKAEGLSGRSLRRLPLKAHAQLSGNKESIPIVHFLQTLNRCIQAEHNSGDKTCPT